MPLGSFPLGSRPLGAGPAEAPPIGFEAAFVKFNEYINIMKKNVASQSIGIQLVNSADGTAFTGTA